MQSDAISASTLDLLLLLRGSEPEGLSRAEQVAHQIETAILMGILSEGDRLPTEAALAAEFGVSPITLRQSLASLRSRGLIRTSRGRRGGSVIHRQVEHTEHQLRQRLRETSTEELRDLGDLGMAIMTTSARLAAARADRHDLERLEDLIRRQEETSEERSRRRLDSRFHVALSLASQSSRLTSAALQLEAETMTLWRGDPCQDAEGAGVLAEHRAILAAVRRRDGAGAAAAAEEHSRTTTARLIAERLGLVIGAADEA